MDEKKICDICGRRYALLPLTHHAINEEPTLETSHIRITIMHPYKMKFENYDTCPLCTRQIRKYISTMCRQAPNKCDFCKHDLGPKHPDYKKGCEGCSTYSNFQLKDRMTQYENYRWLLLNGEV